MISYEQAVDEIFKVFRDTWNAEASAIVGYLPEIRYQGVEEPSKLPIDKYWARVSQQTVSDSQSTLRNGTCGQRYRTNGLVFIQLFCPKSDSLGMTTGRKLATVVRNGYRGVKTSGGVWFSNVRINELPPEDNWYRLNVVAEYEYDEEG